MAKYPAVITTMAGTNTIAEANASKQALIFTKIVIGAGAMPASIPRATALTDKRLELAITKSVKTGDGQFMVQGLLSNKNLEAGFYAREIGLMAKVGENGQEVLFSYTNGGNYVDYVPDKNTPMDSYTFTITTVIGNVEKVQAIVSDNGLASVHDLDVHNKDVLSHPAITAMIAKILGATDWQEDPASTLKDIKNLLGQGAIVASKLDANAGFVKYANGFTIQWGYGGSDKQQKTTVVYPILFSTVFISCAIDAFWVGETPLYLANVANESDNSKAVFMGSASNIGSYYWFAFGKI